jgi:hypothetical protein
MSRLALIRKLDKVFSEWVRRSAATDGYAECFTCRRKLPWKQLHAGHFVSRRHMATRWEPMNVQPQCCGCNTFRAGEQYAFGKRLDETYGPGTADSLVAASRRAVKWAAHELQAEIDRFKGLLSKS